MFPNARRWLLCVLAFFLCDSGFAADGQLKVGAGSIDITPKYPVRLSGFGFRRTESEGVTLPIFAKALAFGDDKEGPAVLITVDNLGVSLEIVEEIAKRLTRAGVKPERLTITATHTHTAPMLKGVAPTLFGTNIPPEHLATIERYTREFTDALETVSLAAIKDIKPAKVSWGIGSVGFAKNRRTQGGPVDHDLPVMMVKDLKGNVRAVYFSYACHCVVLSDNKISGDWAGFAQKEVEKLYPGAVALVSVGCGADSNPSARDTGSIAEKAAAQGMQVAEEIKRLASTDLKPISSRPITRADHIALAFDVPRSREEWETRAKSDNYAIAYHAKLNLERLNRDEKLPTEMTYIIQTWIFGDDLAMVFLPGETVVDYSLRLKREFDRNRLWVNGYSNDERCYVPSERILKEGGYEGGDAMIYYDRPQRFAPGLEEKIVAVVHKQVPEIFAAPKGTEGIPPVGPKESLKLIRTKPGLQVELVASEPQIVDPVAIDWGADGKLWVCEMNDYPTGLDGAWQPGGRIKFLQDRDGDGFYEKATLFMENLPFPTGVTAWGKGVFICAAPDLLYAEDTNGDGKADKVEKIFSGFATENYQARLNSLCIGLDNWIYGANGLLGGVIRGVAGGSEVDIRNRDFRFNPFTHEFQPINGLTQYGRARDDFGNWFGCNNSELLLHFPNSNQTGAPQGNVYLPNYPDSSHVFPVSRLHARFNDLDNANRATSVGGLGIYRDTLLGQEYYGNAFVAETVHNLVHREIIDTNSVRFSSHRAKDEQQSEFFASTDNWFRPVQIRTGPDGALYIVDFYRFVIEHPRWIPAARLAQVDVRAGSDKGRIYRVRPVGKKLRPIRDLTKLKNPELSAALNSPNGTDRDRVHMELLLRNDKSAIPALTKLSKDAPPQVRLQAQGILASFQEDFRRVKPPTVAIAPSTIKKPLQKAEPRTAVLEKYSGVDPSKGKAAAGAQIFTKACATCHLLNGNGNAVGPDLALLRDKDAEYLVKHILDPNAAVEPRFVAYDVELKDDRSLLGIIKAENDNAISLLLPSGQAEIIPRKDVQQIRASTLSLMPEGLEQDITPAQMADLLAYLKAPPAKPSRAPGPDEVLRNPTTVSLFILDDNEPVELRENAITANPQFSAALIVEITRDLPPNSTEETRRIPWLNRIALACGKRNDAVQIRKLLDASLPRQNESARPWQSAAIESALTGIGQRASAPKDRILEIIGNDPDLQNRWRQFANTRQ